LPHKNNGFLVRLKQRGQMVVSPAQSERLQRNLAYTPDSALTLAARSCNPDATRLLLKAGANPNIRRGYGETALITLAFAAGQTARVDACTETARALLQHKANPNAIDEDGHTPLGAAVLSNAPPQFVRVLLKAGADPQPVRAYLWDGANEEVQALLKR
jgi:ankyrin repeat protein